MSYTQLNHVNNWVRNVWRIVFWIYILSIWYEMYTCIIRTNIRYHETGWLTIYYCHGTLIMERDFWLNRGAVLISTYQLSKTYVGNSQCFLIYKFIALLWLNNDRSAFQYSGHTFLIFWQHAAVNYFVISSIGQHNYLFDYLQSIPHALF